MWVRDGVADGGVSGRDRGDAKIVLLAGYIW